MYQHGERRRFCPSCGIYLTVDREPFLFPVTDRPDCPTHRRPMMRQLIPNRVKWRCWLCLKERGRAREAERERRAEEAVRLSAELAARLPSYLTLDERADARQSIALDLLTGKVRAERVTPALLREYAAEARGMASDRFRFISLSQPTRDGREFGETLAA